MTIKQPFNQRGWQQGAKLWLVLSLWLLHLFLLPLRLQASILAPEPPPEGLPNNLALTTTGQEQNDWLIDPTNRQASVNFYLNYYQPANDVPLEWNGDHASCKGGETSAEFREAVLQRINYFRAMAGVPANITLSSTYNQKAQAAALMMSVNDTLDHFPAKSWRCYSEAGAEAARHANLYLALNSPAAIDGYLHDPGEKNYFVAHRRWLLYPQTRQMGTGDVPGTAEHAAANALWVVDDAHFFDSRPATRNDFVAWPPPGYVPKPLIFPRWSLSYPKADFHAAQISMTRNGQPIELQVAPLVQGYGENTIVWEPAAPVMAGDLSSGDLALTVTVANVRVGDEVKSFTYTVTAYTPPTFAPESLTRRLFVPLVLHSR
jgi:uncharacterized protein YkwD